MRTVTFTPSRRQTNITAHLLELRMRASDVVDVIGDDAIGVLLPGTPARELKNVGHRVRAALASSGGSWHVE